MFTASAASAAQHSAESKTAAQMKCLSTQRASTHGDDDKDQRSDRDQDDQKIAVINIPSGKIGLRLVGALSELGKFLVTEAGDGLVDLLRIHAGGFEGLLRFRRGKEFLKRFGILLPDARSVDGGLLQSRRRDEVIGRLGKQ